MDLGFTRPGNVLSADLGREGRSKERPYAVLVQPISILANGKIG
ncbi:hypothetical protein TRICHSKD4_3764 [Roseibium sp. TrichSKD4]|nr:hypothetical protein TRICHSKD4_3764 [Roseibium sp. TrichSKD4]